MDDRSNSPKSWLEWATRPPQSYVIYLATLMLVFVLSFYVGTLKPQKPTGLGPPPASAPSTPRN
jgi:hypothetical protein